MFIKHLDRAGLHHENGLDAQRLLPWSELNAPFEGSWCVIRPGTASTAHGHHEYEIFIALSGEAVLESRGERVPFKAGDIVHFPPHHEHRVINESGSDFEMYSIWWDAEMGERFAVRHGDSQQTEGA
ncbi:cupin domain-containing protein [Streptomyces chattanoogensis]|uniref:cupin domain-containing protein n=1 Tax=Streptomyces chattanoogensis TaxID=66876 RepID=UPI0036AAF845